MDTLRNTQEAPQQEKTPIEKLQETINSLNEYQQNLSLTDILLIHMERNPKDFHAAELNQMLRRLELELYIKICRLMAIADVAEERAEYLKKYLEGKMFTSEKAAREHLPMQIKNADEIITKCKERWK